MGLEVYQFAMTTENKPDLVTNLQKHWFLILALVACTSVWGEARAKISNLEDAVKANAATQSQVARLDERTKLMLESQARQELLIQKMYESQKRVEKMNTRGTK